MSQFTCQNCSAKCTQCLWSKQGQQTFKANNFFKSLMLQHFWKLEIKCAECGVLQCNAYSKVSLQLDICHNVTHVKTARKESGEWPMITNKNVSVNICKHFSFKRSFWYHEIIAVMFIQYLLFSCPLSRMHLDNLFGVSGNQPSKKHCTLVSEW